MRVHALDSIRGLAAFIVVLNHCFLMLPDAVARTWIVPVIKWTPLRVIMVGRAAVIIFFVLSGLALGLSLIRARTDYASFLVRRICRIYPAYVVAILFAAALLVLAQPQPIEALTPWFNKNWADGAGAGVVSAHLLMLNRPSDASLDSVVWSLAYEMRISMLFPLLLAAALRIGSWRFAAVSIAVMLAVELALRMLGIESGAYHNANLIEAVLTTAHYLPFFAAGLLMALHHEALKSGFARLGKTASLALWLVAGACITQYSDFIGGVGAVLIIGLVLASPMIEAWLNTRLLAWLGKISYSLYLFHLPILLFATHQFYGELPIVAYMVPAVLVSLLVADLAYRSIEAPFIEIGRTLTRPKREAALSS